MSVRRLPGSHSVVPGRPETGDNDNRWWLLAASGSTMRLFWGAGVWNVFVYFNISQTTPTLTFALFLHTCASISASLPPSALCCTQGLLLVSTPLTSAGTQRSFYEIPALGLWQHDWLPCGEDRGTILCPGSLLKYSFRNSWSLLVHIKH